MPNIAPNKKNKTNNNLRILKKVKNKNDEYIYNID